MLPILYDSTLSHSEKSHPVPEIPVATELDSATCMLS